MGLFHHRTTSSSHSIPQSHSHPHVSSMDPQSLSQQQQQLDSRSSSSSSRSTHSAHSNTTVRARGPRTSNSIPTYDPFVYAVGSESSVRQQHEEDIDMTDSTYLPSSNAQHSHSKRSSYAPPVPPSRTSSLGHADTSTAIMMSATQMPSRLIPQGSAAPGPKQSTKRNQGNIGDHPNTIVSPTSRSHTLGHGSLDVSEVDLPQDDGRLTFPVPGQRSFGNDPNEDSDEDEMAKLSEEQRATKAKDDRRKEKGRLRQARKRERDRAAKEVRLL